MSEEIKDIILDVKDSLNETPKNMYKYNKIVLNLNEFEEILNYIEQLENIRKEIKKEIKKYAYTDNFGDTVVLAKYIEDILNKGSESDVKDKR